VYCITATFFTSIIYWRADDGTVDTLFQHWRRPQSLCQFGQIMAVLMSTTDQQFYHRRIRMYKRTFCIYTTTWCILDIVNYNKISVKKEKNIKHTRIHMLHRQTTVTNIRMHVIVLICRMFAQRRTEKGFFCSLCA
jgi:hypothetical protein